jgi:hypothetical protein
LVVSLALGLGFLCLLVLFHLFDRIVPVARALIVFSRLLCLLISLYIIRTRYTLVQQPLRLGQLKVGVDLCAGIDGAVLVLGKHILPIRS